MTREKYKEWLVENCDLTNFMEDAIYIIDGIMIDGNYYNRIRYADHNEVKCVSVEWEQVIEWGTIVVPETKVVFGGTDAELIGEFFGFEVLDIDDNHIMGWSQE